MDGSKNVTEPHSAYSQQTPGPTQSEQLECVLHTASSGIGEKTIIPFKDTTWQIVKIAASSRGSKKNFRKSKYVTVIESLPPEFEPNHGYHVKCYSNFTAVAASQEASINEPARFLRSENSPASTSTHKPSSSGIFATECIFCKQDNVIRRRGRPSEPLGCCETRNAEKSIKDAARFLKDDNMLTMIAHEDMIAKECKYHHSCKNNYIKRSQRNTEPSNIKTDVESAMRDICNYIESSIIVDRRSELLTSVYTQYIAFCDDLNEEPFSCAQTFLRAILDKFKGRLKSVTNLAKKHGVILYNADIAGDSVRVAYDFTASPECAVTKCAVLLRKALKSVKRTDFPEFPTTEDLMKGEASPPDIVRTFFKVLYGGPNAAKYSPKVIRLVDSSTQDALFIANAGKVKPEKHISLGIAIKSLTGSKKVVTLLNKFGHCVNYNCIQEIETALGSGVLTRDSACPDGTLKNLPIGLAFDNYDEITNTLSGADSLHDTMGILYQNVGEAQPVSAVATTSQRKFSKKRKLDFDELDLEPYRKKPKMSIFDYTETEVQPYNNKEGDQLDLFWMMCHAVKVPNTPMWVGFNSRIIEDKLPKQQISYLANLRKPITGLDVVQETLNITQRCAKEVGLKYGVVTYDLNAAKPAMQVQATETPKYDKVFVMPGPFHIEMSFFKAIGKLIDGSGGPSILTDSGVLAPGSLKGFLAGKNFNRCKRIHPILALAFEILHFLKFLETYEGRDEVYTMIAKITKYDRESWKTIETSNVFKDCVESYNGFCNQTRSGHFGSTAQYWYMYIEYIHHFHRLDRAVRTNEVETFAQALTPIIGLFFMSNHGNYSRWLSKFQMDLVNIDSTHPGLRDLLKAGIFSVRRTDHQFSRLPVDLTLEQTINADAASRLTGYTHMTNSYSARLRWMVTKASRAAIIQKVKDMAGMTKNEDVTADLRPSKLKRNTSDLQTVLDKIQQTCDPFKDTGASKTLFNIYTGKAASTAVQECLINLPERGNRRHKEFVDECILDAGRFEKPIKRVKFLTFQNEGARNSRSNDKKVAELRCTRDLMGRLAVIGMEKKFDLEHIFSYPLTPVPLSMFSTDGTMAKTNKSALLHELEKRVESSHPSTIDAVIVDGNFLLHTIVGKKATTYGQLARTILIQIRSLSKFQVDILFDTYQEPSIKDSERSRRKANEQKYLITGAEQRCPVSLSDALKSSVFKQQLPAFLVNEWTKEEYACIIGDAQVYLGHLQNCYRYQVVEGQIQRDIVVELENNHHEADTRICLHAAFIDKKTNIKNIVIRASDTDIAVVMVHHAIKFQAKLWMEVGTSFNNSQRYIGITDIAKSLGDMMCKALPAFHSFTGTDYTSSFVRRGKIRPLIKLEKNETAQRAFGGLSSERPLSTTTKYELEKFTTCMYGAKGDGCSLNEFRFQVVLKSFSPKPGAKNPLDKLKGIDGSNIPPCESELLPHIQRAAFVSRMWENADKNIIDQKPVSKDGWDLIEDSYELIMFIGEQVPVTILDTNQDTNVDNDTNDQLFDDIESSDEIESLNDSESSDDDEFDELDVV